jgi:hypothetical protein
MKINGYPLLQASFDSFNFTYIFLHYALDRSWYVKGVMLLSVWIIVCTALLFVFMISHEIFLNVANPMPKYPSNWFDVCYRTINLFYQWIHCPILGTFTVIILRKNSLRFMPINGHCMRTGHWPFKTNCYDDLFKSYSYSINPSQIPGKVLTVL